MSEERNFPARMAEQGIPKSLVFMKVTENEIYLAGVGMRFNDPYYRSLYTFIYDQGAALNALQMANHAQQEFYQITFDRFIPSCPLSTQPIRYQVSGINRPEGEEKPCNGTSDCLRMMKPAI